MDDISHNLPISDQDILDLATKIEEQGRQFYTSLAKLTSDKEVQDFLNHMAAEEAKHEALFKNLMEEKQDQPYGWENQPEVKLTLRKMFQTDIFPALAELDKSSEPFADLERAFDFAIESEMVSIEFYRLLAEYCENLEAKAVLVMLEKVETEHLTYVSNLKKKLCP